MPPHFNSSSEHGSTLGFVMQPFIYVTFSRLRDGTSATNPSVDSGSPVM